MILKIIYMVLINLLFWLSVVSTIICGFLWVIIQSPVLGDYALRSLGLAVGTLVVTTIFDWIYEYFNQ